MTTMTDRKDAKASKPSDHVAQAAAEVDGKTGVSRLTSGEVWREVAEASFAVIGYVTPSREPWSSGVVYKTIGRQLYVAVAPDSWKARHIAANGRVSMTVPVRRGGMLSLVVPNLPGNGQLPRIGDRAPARLAIRSRGYQGVGA